MNCLVDTPYFCNRQRQTARTLLDLQAAHDVHGGDTAEPERSDEPEHIVPVRCDPIKVDALTRQHVEFAVIGLCVEARTADVRQTGTEAKTQQPEQPKDNVAVGSRPVP
jgi:hypothetical protein